MKKDFSKLKQAFIDDPTVMGQLNHQEMMEKLVDPSSFAKGLREVFKGEDGGTPEKGVDYFTDEESKQWKDEILKGATPEKFKDYFTPKEIDMIADSVRQGLKDEITPIKGKDYFDGEDGKDGQDADEESMMQKLLTRIPKVKEMQPIDPIPLIEKAIKKLPTTQDIIAEIKKNRSLELRDIKGARLDMNDQRWHGGGISDINGLITAGTNVTITGSGTKSDPYVINSSGGGGGTPGGLNLQVQYNNAGSFGGISGAVTNGTILNLTNPLLGGATLTTSTVNGVTLVNGGTSTLYLSQDGTYTTPSGTYVLPTASTTVLGGVKVDGTSITISGGVISATSSGGGTVTSVDVSGGTTGLTTSGGPITTNGTITLAGTLAIANGGTNTTSQTTHGVNYFNGTSIISGSGLTYDPSNLNMLQLIGSNSGRVSIVVQNTNSNGNASFYFQNDRGTLSTYGGLLTGGSTDTGGSIFGLARADRTFLFSDGATSVGFATGTLTATNYVIGTNNTAVITVIPSGNVGIGTATPDTQFHVTGSSNTSYVQVTSGVGLQSNSSGSGLITALNQTPADPTTGISNGANFGFNGAATNFYGMGLGAIRNSAYDMWFQTGASNGGGYRWYIGTTEKMNMSNIGNITIINLATGSTPPTTSGTTKMVITDANGQLSFASIPAGTVTSVTSADANATVATQTTTPVITIVAAPKLTTARTIGTLTGDATTAGSSFDGTANNTNALTLATVNSNVGSFAIATVTVNGKGLVTAASAAATTGSGSVVLATSPTLTTASLGSSTATTQAPSDNSTKVATTAYVAAALLGQDFKEACKYGTTTALPAIVYNNGTSGVGATLTAVSFGAITLDGSTPSVGDRILIKNQVSTFQNGIYVVTVVGAVATLFVLTRSADFNQSFEIDTGDSVFITSGSTLSTTTWAYNGIDQPTMGTDAITFAQTAGQGSFTAGNGITITGTSIAIDTSVTVDKTTPQTLSSKTFVAPVLGTPASGTVTNLTGTASININGTVGATTPSTGVFTTGIINTNLQINFTGRSETLAVKGSASVATALFATTGLSAGTSNGVEIVAGTNSSDYALNVFSQVSSQLFLVRGDGNVGIGTTSPSAKLTIAAGSATAGTAPLKLTSGTNLTTTEAGAIEYDGSHLYFTATNGGTRFQLDQQTSNNVSNTVTQTAHGFTVGQVLKFTSGAYALAKADTAADAEGLGVVSTVIGVNSFIITTNGFITGLTGLTANTEYFLDPVTAGALTATAPTTAGQITKPMFFATTTTTGYVINYRGSVVGPSPTVITGTRFVAPNGYISPDATTSNDNFSANNIAVVQFYLPYTIVVNSLKAQVTTADAAASTIQLGLYTSAGALLAGTTTLSSTSTGLKSGTVTTVTVSPGFYWAAYVTNSATVRCQGYFNSGVMYDNTVVGTAANTVSGGVMPSTLGAISGSSSSNNPPLVLISN